MSREELLTADERALDAELETATRELRKLIKVDLLSFDQRTALPPALIRLAIDVAVEVAGSPARGVVGLGLLVHAMTSHAHYVAAGLLARGSNGRP